MKGEDRMPRIAFWYEFASTYTYLTAMRIDQVAEAAGVEVAWQPFLLGPIFKAQGWATSPFNLYPAKGRYMVRDVTRLAQERGLAFSMPDPFPANSLKAARLAVLGCRDGWVAPFSRAIYEAEFVQGADIASDAVLGGILTGLGLDARGLFAQASAPELKDLLRAVTGEAEHLGIFGAPSFIAEDGELFWGDDRLEAALQHAKSI
jgi:2-hydroxychromene-2-carboxylate isomerase